MNTYHGDTETRRDRGFLTARIILTIGFLLVTSSALAQAPNVKVRLYSLHSEQRIKITARTGELTWKTCEQCEAKHAAALTVESSVQGLKILESQASVPAVLRKMAAAQVLVEGDYRIEPSEGLSLSTNFPVAVKADRNTLKVFLTLPLEDYVTAALAGESGNFQHQESLKAMAVAVRSYAAHFRQRHASEEFDFCDSTHCQTLNFKGLSPQIRAAVEATRGEMLWYQGSPAATFYHQNCGGTLAAAKEAWHDLHAPYLKQQADPYCVRGVPLPWRAQLSRTQLESSLRAQGLAAPPIWDRLEIVSRTPSGRVLKLAFRGTQNHNEPLANADPPQLISASSLRFAIGRSLGWNQVRSDLYDIQTTTDSVIFSGRGAGHGVGLCQAGAEEMAKEGRNYQQILEFYYPGASLGTTARGLAWQKRDSERFEMLSVQPEQDGEILRSAENILPIVESELGWKLDFKPQLKVYPTLDAYRDSTGQPGWIAAFTRDRVIRLQPLAMLQKKSALETTLRHEFVHLLIEARAHAGTPLWFREGLVLYFVDSTRNFEPVEMTLMEIEKALVHPENRQGMERAYVAAKTKVARMVQQNGRETVLVWLSQGLPKLQ